LAIAKIFGPISENVSPLLLSQARYGPAHVAITLLLMLDPLLYG